MRTRIDHVNDAEAALVLAASDVSENFPVTTGERKSDILSEAQVHATLALVEQLRLANLIALAKGDGEWLPAADARHALSEFHRYTAHGIDGTLFEDEYETLRPDIAEALGIKKGDPGE